MSHIFPPYRRSTPFGYFEENITKGSEMYPIHFRLTGAVHFVDTLVHFVPKAITQSPEKCPTFFRP